MTVRDAWNDGRRAPLWIADQVRNDVTMCYMEYASPCGYCLEASMTSPVVSRLRGNDG